MGFALRCASLCGFLSIATVLPARAQTPSSTRPLSIRHVTDADDQGAVAETANFRIHYTTTRTIADRVAQAAEKAKADAETKWFGRIGDSWEPRCELYLHDDAATFCQATGMPQPIPGVSVTPRDGEHLLARRADFWCQAPHWLTAVLPHEITHVVVGSRFNIRRLPPWANEGMAVLAEPRTQIDAHLHNLVRFRSQGLLFSAEELLSLYEYPDRRSMGAFYAQSTSLMEYLVKLKGPHEVTAFLRDGMRRGFGVALRTHFDLSMAEIDRYWQEQVSPDVATYSSFSDSRLP